MKVAIYVKVSAQHQTTESQLIELREVCDRSDWEIVEEYNEIISGTKGINELTELHRLLVDEQRKKFHKVVVWSVDRLFLSMRHLVIVLSHSQTPLNCKGSIRLCTVTTVVLLVNQWVWNRAY